MKKFIMNLLGIEATAKNIRGKKSSGSEDSSGYKHWRANIPDRGQIGVKAAQID